MPNLNKPAHYRAILHLIGHLKGILIRSLKFSSDFKNSPTYKNLLENNITIDEDTITIFSCLSWNDCVDTGRSTGGNITIMQGRPVDHSSRLPILIAMSSWEVEYISADTACMRASHLHMLIYGLKFLGTPRYDGDNVDYEPAKIIIDNEAAICMAKWNKDTAGNRHKGQIFHFIRQDTALKEYRVEWIGTKFQLADILTQVGNKPTFGHL